MTNLDEARRMIDTFASCGANSFVVTKLELEWPGHKKAKWGKTYSLESLREKLPGIVSTAAVRHPVNLPEGQGVMAGENVIIRPTGPGVAFVQLDDLKTPEQLERVRPAALIIHATSPGNYQAWIAVSGVSEDKEQFKEFTRRVRKAVGGNDKSASHATRVAGTENFKAKYGPDFPTVKILEAHPGRIVSREQLEAMGLVAAPELGSVTIAVSHKAQSSPGQYRDRASKVWPDYARSLAGAPPSRDGSGPDRSMADFIWCMTAIDWGWSINDTAAKLPEVSEGTRERVQLRTRAIRLSPPRTPAPLSKETTASGAGGKSPNCFPRIDARPQACHGENKGEGVNRILTPTLRFPTLRIVWKYTLPLTRRHLSARPLKAGASTVRKTRYRKLFPCGKSASVRARKS